MFKFRWFKQLKDKISGQDSMIDFPIDDLPEDVLLIILSFLPEPFLVCVAPKVSRKWKDLCQRQTLWRLKCLRKGVKIPQALPQEYRNYRMLLKNAFGRNLVKNWDASDGLTHWQYGTTDHGFGIDRGQFERKVKVEESTVAESYGSQPLSELNIGTTKCWAISYMMVKLTQSLNFLEEGLTAEILDDLQPAIQVSVWTAARFDCGSHYAVEVTLLDEQSRSLEPEVKFSDTHDVKQWGDSSWVRISHTFRNYGRGVRQLQFSHGGSDRQFWAGFFGPKIAAPCVRIELEDSMIDFPIDDLPEDVLLIILSFLQEPFLVSVAPEVSRKWKDLCQRQTLWRLKCLRKGVKIPQALPQEYRNYRMLLKNAFGRNLVKNWDASDGFTHWQYRTTDHRFGNYPGQFERKAVKVEESTAAESCGSQPLSELNIGTTKCWAISYMKVKLTQSLNFLEEGLTAEILDDLQPAIQVSVWTAARFDCASHYAVEVTLLDEQGRSLEPEVKFSDSHDVEQWGDSSWVRISHTFRNYGRGVRQLQFSHGGSDRQFWAGFFGPKIAAPCVRIELEDN